MHHASGQHGIQQAANVHLFKTCHFAILIFRPEGFGQDGIEYIQDFIVDAAVDGAQAVQPGYRTDKREQRFIQTGFFAAFATHGFRRQFTAGNTAGGSIVKFVGIDCFVRTAPAYPEMPSAVRFGQTVEMDGAAEQSERTESGAFE